MRDDQYNAGELAFVEDWKLLSKMRMGLLKCNIAVKGIFGDYMGLNGLT